VPPWTGSTALRSGGAKRCLVGIDAVQQPSSSVEVALLVSGFGPPVSDGVGDQRSKCQTGNPTLGLRQRMSIELGR
jgi:hypothetical protein